MVQDYPEGIAQVFLIGKNLSGLSQFALFWRQYFYGENLNNMLGNWQTIMLERLFLAEVATPEDFVVEFDKNGKPKSIDRAHQNLIAR